MKKLLSIAIFLIFQNIIFGENITDLNGFRLWQYKSAIKASLGEPTKKITKKDWIYEIYNLPENSYMVFTYFNNFPNNTYSIQISGSTNKTIPFKGLILGDNVEKVKTILGNPTDITNSELPNVKVYNFNNSNYSVEIDENGKLLSIRVFVTNDFFKSSSAVKDNPWENFKKAVLEKDTQAILNWLRPDVEIYKDNKVLSIDKKYSDFIEKTNTQFFNALIADKNSVYAELKNSEPEGSNRFIKELGIGLVYKFPKGTNLQEIVFFPYNGKHRVFEIAFKKK
jgi:hypothetical protein